MMKNLCEFFICRQYNFCFSKQIEESSAVLKVENRAKSHNLLTEVLKYRAVLQKPKITNRAPKKVVSGFFDPGQYFVRDVAGRDGTTEKMQRGRNRVSNSGSRFFFS